jgi:hypothetical protein
MISLKEYIQHMDIAKSDISNVYNFCDARTNGKILDVLKTFLKAERDGADAVEMSETILFSKDDLDVIHTYTHTIFTYYVPRCYDVISSFSSDAEIEIMVEDYILDHSGYIKDLGEIRAPTAIKFIFENEDIPATFYLKSTNYFLTNGKKKTAAVGRRVSPRSITSLYIQ